MILKNQPFKPRVNFASTSKSQFENYHLKNALDSSLSFSLISTLNFLTDKSTLSNFNFDQVVPSSESVQLTGSCDLIYAECILAFSESDISLSNSVIHV